MFVLRMGVSRLLCMGVCRSTAAMGALPALFLMHVKRPAQPLHKRFVGAALSRLHFITRYSGCSVLCCGSFLCACIQLV